MSLAPGAPVTCGGCGKTATWGDGWRYPAVPPEDYYDRRVGKAACSDPCEATLLARGAA